MPAVAPPPQYAVGQKLPSGAVVTSDTVVVGPDGSVTETIVTTGGSITTVTPGAGTPVANAQAIQANLTAQLATIEAFITANPAGAVLTAGETLMLAQMLAGITRTLLGLTSTVGGS